MQSHTLRRMYFSQYQDSPATLGSLTRLPHEKAMCITGASLTKPHINVLNANGVCMYVCMYVYLYVCICTPYRKYIFVEQRYRLCEKSENTRVFLGSLTATNVSQHKG